MSGSNKFTIDIQIEEPLRLDVDLLPVLKTAVITTLQQQKVSPPAELSLVLSDDAAIQALNEQFREEDRATDVLSFPAGVPMPGMNALYLGDIIISVPFAQQQATRNGHPLLAELQLLAIHGTLHLLGHDHLEPAEKEVMWTAQTAVLHTLDLAHITPSEAAHD